MQRRQLIQAATGAALGAAFNSPAFAQEFPTRPVKIIVPTAPGSGTDVTGRFLAERLAKEWTAGVVVENKVGANGIPAADSVAKSPADGYTLLMGLSAMYANKSLYKSLPFDPVKDFRALLGLNDLYLVLIVPASSPFKTVQDLIDYAKARPGKVSYGSAGAGSTTHLGPALLSYMAKAEFLHVPYRGAANALTDTISGQVDFAFTAIAQGAPQITSGRLRALATSGLRRPKSLPDVPTLHESGLTGFNVLSKTFLAAPAALPDPVAERITTAVSRIIQTPAYAQFLEQQGFEPELESPQAYQRKAEEEVRHWAEIVRVTGATSQ
jgi:tripartite-type tricarboxylate transporter receptor subunit TctC